MVTGRPLTSTERFAEDYLIVYLRAVAILIHIKCRLLGADGEDHTTVKLTLAGVRSLNIIAGCIIYTAFYWL